MPGFQQSAGQPFYNPMAPPQQMDGKAATASAFPGLPQLNQMPMMPMMPQPNGQPAANGSMFMMPGFPQAA
jgi:hypothetical protein